MTGGFGCQSGSCGAMGWQLLISSLWRQDPSSGQWYWLRDYGPLAWRYESTIWSFTYGADPGYFVSANANIQMKARFLPNVGTQKWCGDVIDYYLPPVRGNVVPQRPGSPMRAVVTRVALVLAAAILVLATSAVAFAALETPADFRPFTIEKEAWNSQLSSAGPGVERFRIEYRSRDSWTVTLLSHSANPGMNGTRWAYESGGLTLFDAWRNLTRTRQVGSSVDQWIEPGLFRSFSGRLDWIRTDLADGTTEFRQTVPGAASEARVVFDRGSGLPVRVETRRQDAILQHILYRRTS